MAASAPGVLKKFQIDHSGMTGMYVHIETRQPGFNAFLLNLMGLDPTESVTITRGAISMRTSSIKGMNQVTSALTSVGAFLGGYRKPVEYLFAAIFIFFLGLIIDVVTELEWSFIPTIIATIFALVQILFYVFNKVMYIGFETAGGETYTIFFKKSLIEGVPVDINRVEEAIQLVNDLIGSAASGSTVDRTIPQAVLGGGGTIQVAHQEPPVHANAPVAASVPPKTNSPNLDPKGPQGPF